MICSNCKKNIRDGVSFCRYCGTPTYAQQRQAIVDALEMQQGKQESLSEIKVSDSDKPDISEPVSVASASDYPQDTGAKEKTADLHFPESVQIQPAEKTTPERKKELDPDKQPPSVQPIQAASPNKWKVSTILLGIFALVVTLLLLFFILMHFDILQNPAQNSSGEASDGMTQIQDKTEHNQMPPATEETLATEEVVVTEDPADVAYRNAVAYCEALVAKGDYDGAVEYLQKQAAHPNAESRYAKLLDEYQQLRKTSILDNSAAYASEGNYRMAIYLLNDAWKEYSDEDYYNAAAQYRKEFGIYNTSFLAAGKFNTMLLHSDGSVEICGDNSNGELSANYWTNIVAISAGDRHAVGLKSDGTVVACGEKQYGQCDVSGWRNIIAISAGDLHTVGLKSDGTLVAVGHEYFDACNVRSIMNTAGDLKVVSIAAGYYHTLALLENGRVVACGTNDSGVCDVSGWKDIAAIYAGTQFSAGLKNDGTVVVAGLGTSKWDLSEWTDIVNLAAGDYYLIGLKSDGTVLSLMSNTSKNPNSGQNSVSGWDDIIFISAGHDHTVALRSDGEILCVGSDKYGQCDYAHTAFRN